jgi:hypothetical protein
MIARTLHACHPKISTCGHGLVAQACRRQGLTAAHKHNQRSYNCAMLRPRLIAVVYSSEGACMLVSILPRG